MSNVRVCVDIVGGDEKPQVVLDGIEAALAADPDIEVLAAGPAEIVNPFAASHARVEALEAPDVIAMNDDPIRAVMTKRTQVVDRAVVPRHQEGKCGRVLLRRLDRRHDSCRDRLRHTV